MEKVLVHKSIVEVVLLTILLKIFLFNLGIQVLVSESKPSHLFFLASVMDSKVLKKVLSCLLFPIKNQSLQKAETIFTNIAWLGDIVM